MSLDAVASAGRGGCALLCFSHLRWDFVFQRPQHLLSRAARERRVIYWEEPRFEAVGAARLDMTRSDEGVWVARPVLAWGTEDVAGAQRGLLDAMLAEQGIEAPLLWYYTPLAMGFSAHLKHSGVVYDCMDELAAFAEADATLPAQEAALLARADVVFTGGVGLFEAKRGLHRSIHAFPSGVDAAHFVTARDGLAEPVEQAGIGHPRVGFFGVLDERLDLALLAEAADLRPDLHFVLVGPVVKIDPAALPVRGNIHFLGPACYDELPNLAAHWDVAMIPFALNASTRFISPTKTPEYLAAGCPVVSTPVRDVVRAWGDAAFVGIAGDAAGFVREIDRLRGLGRGWLGAADARLACLSWDAIWARMSALLPRARTRRRLRRARYDCLVVGAGFAGSVMAERLAAGSGRRVLVVDQRAHIGGNAYDAPDADGVLVHPYGPHIFHTNSEAVLAYLSRFTAWRPYEHRVRALVGGRSYALPINRATVNAFFGLDLAEAEVAAFLRSKAEAIAEVRTSADVVLGSVGRELYEAFFRDYTRKQWGVDPSGLDKSVAARVPARTGDDDRYFTDRFQCMPLEGYTRMFERMLDHPGIEVATETAYEEVDRGRYDELVFTGPIDAFFGHRFGRLPYRSLQFRHETHGCERMQDVGVINHPGVSPAYTRVTEFKHLTGQVHGRTSLCYEYPSDAGDPYYPVPRPENAALYARYRALADATPGVSFVGRLATYRYMNMDQVVGQALATYARWCAPSPGRADQAAAD